MRVLVTGGAGYAGAVLVPMLLRRGHTVRVLDTLHYGNSGLRACRGHPLFGLSVGDVRDGGWVRRALRGADAVVHLAAVVGYPACAASPDQARTTNVEGTRTLLRLRHRDQRFVLASTVSVYGHVPGGICDETTPPAPLTLYGETKAAAERMVLDSGNSVALRFPTMFGAGPVTRLDLLPNDLTFAAIRDRRLILYEPHVRRTFLHVRDVARSVLFALGNWDAMREAVYNVGDESMNMTKAELAQAIRRHVEFALDLGGQGQDLDRRDYAVSFEKLRRLGFRPRVDIGSGIAEMALLLRDIARNVIASQRVDVPVLLGRPDMR